MEQLADAPGCDSVQSRRHGPEGVVGDAELRERAESGREGQATAQQAGYANRCRIRWLLCWCGQKAERCPRRGQTARSGNDSGPFNLGLMRK